MDSKKNVKNYFCETCNYISCSKKDFNKHILTPKHKKFENASKMLVDASNISLPTRKYACNCGKTYNHDSSYYRHKKTCSYEEEETDNNTDETPNMELIHYLMKENKEIKEMILEIVKNGIVNNTHMNSHNTNTTTNSHNKAFNLNFFLNETCKNAMNITDFVDSIHLQLSDLMEVGELGYVEGISKIIVKNLNQLDETERPIHCTDKKRETMYIKDQGEWSKEDDKKTNLKRAITRIADKNLKLLPVFREKFPEYRDSSSKISDVHDKLVVEVMETDDAKKDKIVHNISKVTNIREK